MLRSLIKESISEEEFFSSIYQTVPKVFASNDEHYEHTDESPKNINGKKNEADVQNHKSNTNGNLNDSNKKRKIESTTENYDHDLLFNKIISLNVNDITNVLEISRRTFDLIPSPSNNENIVPTPLFFKDKNVLSADDMLDLYNNNPLAAYVDGCSIILNHLELIKEDSIGKLCKELEKNPSFPTCFANGYLTPPNSQAVSAHADDRDVFILQVFGEKNWKVYKDVPIPFPYHHEQVGKNGIPIPQSIVTKKPLIERKLVPGDVLYMPRGFVHEAYTVCNQKASFHITIALPTHDWSYSNIFNLVSRQLLDQDVSLRKAINPLSNNSTDVEQHIQHMITILQQNINSKSLINMLHQKSEIHEEKSIQISQYLSSQITLPNNIDSFIGYDAVHMIQFSSTIRAATDIERKLTIEKEKSALEQPMKKARGLTVREENGDILFSILQFIKSNPKDTFVISQLRTLPCCSMYNDNNDCIIDNLSILCFIKCCVEFGAIALVSA